MAVNKGFHRTRERVQSSFERMVPQYFLNQKGMLEESPILKDTQEQINSVEYTHLDEIYDRMLEIEAQQRYVFNGGDMVQEREGLEDDLSKLIALDEMRDRYSIENPDVVGMSHSDIVKYIKGKLDKANQKIKDYNEERNNNNAQKNEPKSEQTELPSNS